jgi:hypothetical protein
MPQEQVNTSANNVNTRFWALQIFKMNQKSEYGAIEYQGMKFFLQAIKVIL